MDKILETSAETLAEQAPSVKVCTKCGVEDFFANFPPRKSGKLGKSSWCRSCHKSYWNKSDVKQRHKARQQKYRQSEGFKERSREYQRAYYQRPEIKAAKTALRRIREQRPDVKERNRKLRLARMQKPEVRQKERNRCKAYMQRPEIKAKQKIYMQCEAIKAWKKHYEQNRRKTDAAFRLAKNLRNRLYQAINGALKSARTLELVGCDIGFLRRWIEAKWKPGMSWQNYGKWHVDHIMPCAMFDLSDPVQQRTCFRWTNLQPLWAHENISKSDRVES